jgi:hypothetical protein
VSVTEDSAFLEIDLEAMGELSLTFMDTFEKSKPLKTTNNRTT